MQNEIEAEGTEAAENVPGTFATVDMAGAEFIPVARGRKSEPDEIAQALSEVLVAAGDRLSLGEFSKGVVLPVPPVVALPGDDKSKLEKRKIAARVQRVRKLVENVRGEKLNVNYRELVSSKDGTRYHVVYVRRTK